MKIGHILILLFYALGVQSIQGMKNLNKKTFFKDLTPAFLKKTPIRSSRYYSNTSNNLSKNTAIAPAMKSDTDLADLKNLKTNHLWKNIETLPLEDSTLAILEKDVTNIFEQIQEKYKIPNVETMIQDKDPKLDKYTPDFFKKHFEEFKLSMESTINLLEEKFQYLKDNESEKSNIEALIQYVENEYDNTLKRASIDFGRAQGLVKRYNTHKKSNQTTLQRAKNFITNWRTYLFGKRADKNTQKRTYATTSHKNPGTGYFAKKLGKRSYSSFSKTPYKGPLSKEMTENSFDINAIKKSLEDPKTIIENYKKIFNKYMLEYPELETMEEFRDYIEYRKEKAAEIIKVINENSDIKSQIDDYNETLKISHDESIKPLVDTLISIENKTYVHSIVYLFEDALNSRHASFYDKAATEKSKLEIMAARIYLLSKNLENNLDSINIQNINKNPFYKIAKHNYYIHTTGFGYSKNNMINTFKKNLYNSFDHLTIPMRLDDLLNSMKSKNYLTLSDSENVQDLCFFLLFDYLIYSPGCTAEKLTQFYAFLNKMKNDKDYRKNEIDKLIPSQKNDEEGIWKKFSNLF